MIDEQARWQRAVDFRCGACRELVFPILCDRLFCGDCVPYPVFEDKGGSGHGSAGELDSGGRGLHAGDKVVAWMESKSRIGLKPKKLSPGGTRHETVGRS